MQLAPQIIVITKRIIILYANTTTQVQFSPPLWKPYCCKTAKCSSLKCSAVVCKLKQERWLQMSRVFRTSSESVLSLVPGTASIPTYGDSMLSLLSVSEFKCVSRFSHMVALWLSGQQGVTFQLYPILYLGNLALDKMIHPSKILLKILNYTSLWYSVTLFSSQR